jgi:peptidyl-prolyl cis-trans isomerase C
MSSAKQWMAASIAFAIGAAMAAEAPRPGDKPLVENGSIALTTLDFDAYMERVPPELRDEFRAEDAKINPTIDALWVKRVLAARARETGMDKDPLMAARLRQAEEDVLAEEYLKRVEAGVKVPDLEARARELYQVRQKDFAIPEKITAEHILVSTRTYSKDQARARAQEAYKRAVAGEDFHKLAEEYTDNKASIEINAMASTSFVKPLPEALAKMKPGDIMPPTESQYGFHVMKLKDKVPAGVKPFADVKGDLIASEKQRLIDDQKTAVVEAIRADPKNVLYVENVRALKGNFKPPTVEEIKKLPVNVRK